MYPEQIDINKGEFMDFSTSILSLPKDVTIEIFSYLSEEELRKCSFCSKKFLSYSRNERLYKALCQKQFPETSRREWIASYAGEKSWYDTFQLLKGRKLPSHSFHTTERFGPYSVALEGPLLAVADLQGITIWDLLSNKKVKNFSPQIKLGCCRNISLALTKEVIVSAYDRALFAYNLSGVLLSSFKGHTGLIECLDIENNFIASGSIDDTVKLWDLTTKQCIKTLSHPNTVISVLMRGDRIVSGCSDGCVRVWSQASGDCLITLELGKKNINSISVQDDLLASGGNDGKVRIWNLETKKCIRIFESDQGKIQQVILQNNFVASLSHVIALHANGHENEGRWWPKEWGQEDNSPQGMSTIRVWSLSGHSLIKISMPADGECPKIAMQGEVIATRGKSASKEFYLIKTLGNYPHSLPDESFCVLF